MPVEPMRCLAFGSVAAGEHDGRGSFFSCPVFRMADQFFARPPAPERRFHDERRNLDNMPIVFIAESQTQADHARHLAFAFRYQRRIIRMGADRLHPFPHLPA